MTLPQHMTDRWARRPDPQPGERTLYWHVLMRDYPPAVEVARQAGERLAGFTGLHLTPSQWLHMTVLVAGPADQYTDQQMQHMIRTAAVQLADLPPARVSLGKILYHPEAIMLAVTPTNTLAPLRTAAVNATEQATGQDIPAEESWTPHVTLAYSTASQPAQPIIDTLGMRLPTAQVLIGTLSLVVQDGPERTWNWSTVGTIRLAAPALA